MVAARKVNTGDFVFREIISMWKSPGEIRYFDMIYKWRFFQIVGKNVS